MSRNLDTREIEEFDVVVIGAGIAGSSAAIAAREKGAKVLILEKAPISERGGNGRFTGGGFRFVHKGNEEIRAFLPDIPESQLDLIDVKEYTHDDFYSDIMRVTNGLADQVLCEIIVKESNAAFKWVNDLGIKWDANYEMAVRMGERMVFSKGAAILNAVGGGEGFVEAMLEIAQNKGIEIRHETKAVNVLVDNSGRVYGVTARGAGVSKDIHCKAVIMAAGGFSSNAEMRTKYLGKGWDLVKVRGTKHNTGEILNLALQLGAQSVGEWSGQHCTQIDWGAPAVAGGLSTDRKSYTFGILVNTEGKRFCDEGEDFHGYTYAKLGRTVLAQPNCTAYQIYDSKVFDLFMSDYSNQTPIQTNSIEELAEELDLDPAVLTQTVNEFNAAVQDATFDPAVRDGKRTIGLSPNKTNWAQTIDTAPFRAYPVTAGITFTFGGIKTDKRGRVLDTENNPIQGLYANGEMVGGFFYHNYPGGTGIMRSLVMGRIAGADAATSKAEEC